MNEYDQEYIDGGEYELCPHCEASLPHFQDVIDSGEPYYVLGVICPSCGRFIELDEAQSDEL